MCSTILQKLPRSTDSQFLIAPGHSLPQFSLVFLPSLSHNPTISQCFLGPHAKETTGTQTLSQVHFLAEIMYVNDLRLP